MNIIEHHPIEMKRLRDIIRSSYQSAKWISEMLKREGFSFEATHYLVTGYLPRKWNT